MKNDSNDSKLNNQDLFPNSAKYQGDLVSDALDDLVSGCIADFRSFVSGTDEFYSKIKETLKYARFTDIKKYVKKLDDLSYLYSPVRSLPIIYAMTLLAVCNTQGWQKTSQEREEAFDIIKTLPEERLLMLEYGNFCLSQYSKMITESENAGSVYKSLREIQREVRRLICVSKGREEILSIYSAILAEQLKSYDLDKAESISENLRRQNEFIDSNALIYLSYMKSTLLSFSKLLNATKSESLFRQTEMDFGMTNVFSDLLTNLLLTEEIKELGYFQKYLFQYMDKETEGEIQLNEYAGMLAFMSIDISAEKFAQLVSVGKELLDAFPAKERVETAYGYILYRGMNDLESEDSQRYRKELIRLICIYPENEKIRGLFAGELDSVTCDDGLLDLVERKREIETSLRKFLDFDEELIKQYVRLLEIMSILQTLPNAIMTMKVMDRFKQKHAENVDVAIAYESMLKILTGKPE